MFISCVKLCVDGALQGGSSAVLQDGSLPADMLLVRHASAARRLQRAYAGTAVVTCTLWVVVTVAHYVHTRTVEFTIWLPAVADEPLQLVFLLLVVLMLHLYGLSDVLEV